VTTIFIYKLNFYKLKNLQSYT